MSSSAGRIEESNALLLAACRVGGAEAEIPSGPFDSSYLLRAAETQGVAPLVYDWLTRHPDVAIDSALAHHLRDAYWATHLRNKLILEELDRLSAAAADAGIEIMPAKGARLAAECYRRPALRPLSDLDLLVRPRDLPAVADLFRALGYRTQNPPPTYLDSDRLDASSREYGWVAPLRGLDLLVEVRTQPIELALGRLTDFDRGLSAALRAHGEQVWARAEGGALARMSTEDMLLHVATHFAAKHVEFRLIWMHDLARLVMAHPSCDWEYVWATSARLRVGAAVAAALCAAARWMGSPLPEACSSGLTEALSGRPAPMIARLERRRLAAHVDAIGRRDLTSTGPAWWHFATSLGRIRGWGARLRVVRWVAFPSRDYLAFHGHSVSHGTLGYLAGWSSRITRAASSATRSAVASKSADSSS